MISVCQIKAAHFMLNWSAAELAKASEIGPVTICWYKNQVGISPANTSTLLFIQTTLEGVGIEFTGNPLFNTGVVFCLTRDSLGL
jgi:hypothetical protein